MQSGRLKVGNAAVGAVGRLGIQAWKGVKERAVSDTVRKFYDGGFRGIATTREKDKSKQEVRPPRHLTIGWGKSAGRNSQGRITSYHRGGGAKRLQRIVDVKRSTEATGVIERIEYDPNRSAKLALVVWDSKVHPRIPQKCKTMENFSPSEKLLEPATTTVLSFSSIAGKSNDRSFTSFSSKPAATYLRVGSPTTMQPSSKSFFNINNLDSGKPSVKDSFLATFSTSKSKCKIRTPPSSSLSIPTIPIAGPKPLFFSPQTNNGVGEKTTFSLSEIQKWKGRGVWEHRLKQKEPASWVSSRQKDSSSL